MKLNLPISLIFAMMICIMGGTGVAGTPRPIINVLGGNWAGGDAYLLHRAQLGTTQPVEIYKLPEGKHRLEWIGTWENTGTISSSVFTSTSLFILGSAEFIYWRNELAYWLKENPRVIVELNRLTSRPSVNIEDRNYIYNSGNSDPENFLNFRRQDLDTGEEESVLIISSEESGLIGSGSPYVIDENRYILTGALPNGRLNTYIIDTSTSPTAVNFHSFGPFNTWLDTEDEIFVSAGPSGIIWYDVLTQELVRSVGPMVISEVRAETNQTHFLGRPDVVEVEGKFETRIPAAVWEDDYTTQPLTYLVIDHPDTLPTPQDYVDHLLGTGRVNEILFLAPDRNGDDKIDVADLVQRVNEVSLK